MNLQIETTNQCQCRCSFCLRPLDPPKMATIIDENLFKRIIHDAKEFNIQQIYLTGLGDPFFDPELEWRISYISKMIPNSIIGIYTNGILATQKRLNQCVKNGLTYIYFSLNAATPVMHEQIMGIKDQYETVCKNLQYALTIKSLNTKISVVLGLQWLEPGEFQKIQEQWPHINSQGEELVYGHTAGNWAGRIYKLTYLPTISSCRWIDEYMYINIKGDVCHCCLDPYGKFSFGNIMDSKQTLKSIWYGEKRKIFLKRIKENGRAGEVLCAGCSTI